MKELCVKKCSLFNTGNVYRQSVQENIDMIKLQRDVKEKSTRLIALQEKYSVMEEVGSLLQTFHFVCLYVCVCIHWNLAKGYIGYVYVLRKIFVCLCIYTAEILLKDILGMFMCYWKHLYVCVCVQLNLAKGHIGYVYVLLKTFVCLCMCTTESC